ncbi:uncharacterized protein KY384_001018 [Bacidia gigantensis]|uniref:uncharacterized protein n=1 Tax=Bacidia gigantensis TaxID=2732470 RepID=UPI001D043D35|nr:uncharacterized protein KY384_001018 [Bacidia gigantensis]KAG8534174.1 hypothetical protein KY384_001018 [Bacidia gigantensis]
MTLDEKEWDRTLRLHNEHFGVDDEQPTSTNHVTSRRLAYLNEVKTNPLFGAEVLRQTIDDNGDQDSGSKVNSSEVLKQYALLARVLEPGIEDQRLFLNVNTPWSAFLCGSQGSGKSYTLSCMLESSLKASPLGRLEKPLAGLVFHYDTQGSVGSKQICEAAFLASKGIPVKVLVAPWNFESMRKAYTNLKNVPTQPEVTAFCLREEHLNVGRMMRLMACEGESKNTLYMQTVNMILRSLALQNPHMAGLKYQEFKERIHNENFSAQQQGLVDQRLSLLESFLYLPGKSTVETLTFSKGSGDERKRQAARDKEKRTNRSILNTMFSPHAWSFEPGSLTIVDLSCPFVDQDLACDLYNIAMDLFLARRGTSNLIIALDEAHKFLTGSEAGNAFTESMLSVIRQQRHLGTSVIIATQEPTIAPSLLDLCSMTIVHRFTSPNWLKALESHLAGMTGATEGEKGALGNIFNRIVELDVGHALLFSPTLMLTVIKSKGGNKKASRLGTRHLKIQVRKRLTADGGVGFDLLVLRLVVVGLLLRQILSHDGRPDGESKKEMRIEAPMYTKPKFPQSMPFQLLTSQ